MFKFISVFALLSVAAAAPGLIAQTHSIVQPAVYTKTYAAAPVVQTYAANAFVKTYSAPVVQTYAASPYVKTIATPLVQTYSAAPVIKTIASPVVHSYAAPVVHSAPLFKTVLSAPVAYTSLYH